MFLSFVFPFGVFCCYPFIEIAAGFYKGRIAEAIAAAVQERGGVMTVEDLGAHKCEHREPISTTYRGYRIYEVAPPTAVSTCFNRSLRSLPGLQSCLYSRCTVAEHLMRAGDHGIAGFRNC